MSEGVSEVLIYIVLMIIAGAGSVLKAVAEKKRKVSAPPIPQADEIEEENEDEDWEGEERPVFRQPENSFEEIIRHLTGQQEEVVAATPESVPVINVDQDHFKQAEEKRKLQSIMREQKTKAKRGEHFSPLFVQEDEETSGDAGGILSEGFDARKAIIYSEILTRKY